MENNNKIIGQRVFVLEYCTQCPENHVIIVDGKQSWYCGRLESEIAIDWARQFPEVCPLPIISKKLRGA